MDDKLFKLYSDSILNDSRLLNSKINRSASMAWAGSHWYDHMTWSKQLTRLSSENYPTHMFEVSTDRTKDDGTCYKLWDFIVGNGDSTYAGDSIHEPTKLTDILPRRPNKSEWWKGVYKHYCDKTLDELDAYVMDAQNNDHCSQLVDAAHVLAHMAGDKQETRAGIEHQLERTSKHFAQAIADLTVARALGLPFKPNAPNRLPYGIVAIPTLRLGFESDQPVLIVPHDPSYVDNVFVAVLVVIEVGNDPIKLIAPTAKIYSYNDNWSYQPVRAFIGGWETMAFISTSQMVSIERIGYDLSKKKLGYGVHVNDLLTPLALNFYLDVAKSYLPEPKGYITLRDWQTSREFIEEEEHTPILPCMSCFMKNGAIEGGVQLPRVPRPKKLADCKEWSACIKHIRAAYKIVESVKEKHFGDKRLFKKNRAEKRRNYENRLKRYRRIAREKRKW